MEMQIKNSSSAIAVADKILKEGGYKHFWRGNLMNLIRVTPHKVIHDIMALVDFVTSRDVRFKEQLDSAQTWTLAQIFSCSSYFQLIAALQAVNFYSFYVYRTALSKFLAAGEMSLGGCERFIAGAFAGRTLHRASTFHPPNKAICQEELYLLDGTRGECET